MLFRWRLIALILSAVIFLASLVLWVGSYFRNGAFEYTANGGTRELSLGSALGRLGAGITDYNNFPMRPGWRMYWAASQPRLRRNEFWGLFDFEWINRVNGINMNRTNKGPLTTIHTRAVVLPIWTVTLLSGLCPAWYFFFVERKKHRWIRRDISLSDPRLIARIGRFTIFSAVGLAAGLAVAWAAMTFPDHASDWLWLTPWILLPIAILMAVYTRRRVLWHRAMLWLSLDFAGCVCFFQSTIQHIWNYYFVYSSEIGIMFACTLLTGLACLIFGAILLLFLQVKPEPVKPGPYCPQCGYCLIGSTRKICTECGRPFSLEELGVTPEELLPPAIMPAR